MIAQRRRAVTSSLSLLTAVVLFSKLNLTTYLSSLAHLKRKKGRNWHRECWRYKSGEREMKDLKLKISEINVVLQKRNINTWKKLKNTPDQFRCVIATSFIWSCLLLVITYTPLSVPLQTRVSDPLSHVTRCLYMMRGESRSYNAVE